MMHLGRFCPPCGPCASFWLALLALIAAGSSGMCAERVRIDAGLPGYEFAATGPACSLACPQVPPFRYFEQMVSRMTARHGQDSHSRGAKRR